MSITYFVKKGIKFFFKLSPFFWQSVTIYSLYAFFRAAVRFDKENQDCFFENFTKNRKL